ncbi:hypothetical protein [Nostoc sp. MG11]|uniref:hypothetical protein n=1 Tax=Nostoc sp. MG11 TaxID=2721166 RepID=UPI001D02216E|nr:hypothetical protein [Nostoc sp. MG11]
MITPKVFADFQNAYAEKRLRLNCIGTIEDLANQSIELQDGQLLTLYSEDLEVDGVVQFSEEEKLWVAAIDWERIRQVEILSCRHKFEYPRYLPKKRPASHSRSQRYFFRVVFSIELKPDARSQNATGNFS